MLREALESVQAVLVKGVTAAQEYSVLTLERLVANGAPVLDIAAIFRLGVGFHPLVFI